MYSGFHGNCYSIKEIQLTRFLSLVWQQEQMEMHSVYNTYLQEESLTHAPSTDISGGEKAHPFTYLNWSDPQTVAVIIFQPTLMYEARYKEAFTVPLPSLSPAPPASSGLHRRPRRSEVNRPTGPATWFLPPRIGSRTRTRSLCAGTGTCRCLKVTERRKSRGGGGELMCSYVTSGHATSNISLTERRGGRSLVIGEIPIEIQFIQ